MGKNRLATYLHIYSCSVWQLSNSTESAAFAPIKNHNNSMLFLVMKFSSSIFCSILGKNLLILLLFDSLVVRKEKQPNQINKIDLVSGLNFHEFMKNGIIGKKITSNSIA